MSQTSSSSQQPPSFPSEAGPATPPPRALNIPTPTKAQLSDPLKFMSSCSSAKLSKPNSLTPPALNPITPLELKSCLNSDQQIVVIDVRPFSMYSHNHIKTSKSLCIPSTLLKRQTFGFERIMDFVPPQDIDTLKNIDKAHKIVFYDHSSFHCTPDSSLNRTGLKILGGNENLADKLYWLKGGMNAAINEIPEEVIASRQSSIDHLASSSTPDLLQSPPNAIDIPAFHQSPSNSKLFSAPKSPFGLMPVLTKLTDKQDLRSPLQTPLPYLDDASRQLLTEDTKKYSSQFPPWMATVISSIEEGESVIVEGFKLLELEESNRVNAPSQDSPIAGIMSPRNFLTSPININASPTTPKSETSIPSLGSVTPQFLNFDFDLNTPRSNKFAIIAGDDPSKNRYTNIAPYSHSRVEVGPQNKYFNGSLIQTKLSPLTYIATQAPVPASFSDFWWLVWERQCPLIVMLTTLKTMSGRTKAHNYWKEQVYNGLHVKVVEKKRVDVSGVFIIVRKIELKLDNELRLVQQLHYEDWPDLGCPADPEEVLKLVEYKSSLLKKVTNGEMRGDVVVHCSAGCGRTGTFCAVDLVTDIMRNKRPYDKQRDLILDVVCELREQRMSMVQNQKQYVLCYQAVILWLIRRLKRGD